MTCAPSSIGAISSSATSRRYDVAILARRDERLPSRDIAAFDARETDGHPLARLCAIDVTVVHLDAPHSNVAPRRLQPQLIPGPDRARPERPRHDGPETGNRERAVDVQPRRPGGAPGLDRIGEPRQGRAELVEPFARTSAHTDDLDAGHELACLPLGKVGSRRVDGVDLRQCHDAALDAEKSQDRKMLVRLRPRTLTGVDHEQEEVDPRRARHHRADEPLVAWNVDHGETAPVG